MPPCSRRLPQGRLATAEDVRREAGRLLDEDKVPARVERFFEEYFEYPAALEVFKDLSRAAHGVPR